MANDVVPFGKYRGKPIEALASDREYVDWLVAQSWFRDRYQNLYTLVINNFAEPSETPEHNALQARFLDDEFCVALLKAVKWRPAAAPEDFIREEIHSEYGLIKKLNRKRDELLSSIDGRLKNIARVQEDIKIHRESYYINYLKSCETELSKSKAELQSTVIRLAHAERYAEHPTMRMQIDIKSEFEIEGWDVVLYCAAEDHASEVRAFRTQNIEIKPSLSDEFPAVLRQIRARKPLINPTVVIERFEAVGASLEQVRKIFDMPIVTIAEIEAAAAE